MAGLPLAQLRLAMTLVSGNSRRVKALQLHLSCF
jgi:hypothetical protein